MTHQQRTSLLSPLATLMANLACRMGGLPSLEDYRKQLDEKKQQIEQINQQQQALFRVISKIRASLDLDTIFRTTTKETCKLLKVERIAVYRFFEDWGGEFIHDFEFSQPGWGDVEALGKNTVWNDSYLQEHQGGRYRQNEMLVVSDIYQAGLSQCHVEMLEQFHIRAYATAPIFIGQQLWGVLAAYQHSESHTWSSLELTYLSQVATQLGFAVKQAELLTNTEQKAKELQLYNKKQQILYKVITEIRESLDLSTLFATTAKEVRKAMSADRVAIYQFKDGTNYSEGHFIAEDTLPRYDSVLNHQVRDHCFGERVAPAYLEGKMHIVSDVSQADLHDCHVALLKRFQVQAQIVIPITGKETLWGLLCIHQCSEPRQWQDIDIEFLQNLVVHFNVALEQADLLAHSQLQAEKLAKLTRLDPLLQIANRRYLEEILDKEWLRLRRDKAYLSLIVLDLDYFGRYNNLYGHPAGDTCLIKVTQAIKSVLKRSTDFLARWGGEEFIIVLPNTDIEGTIAIAQEIKTAIQALAIPHEDRGSGDPYVTISMGLSSQIPNEKDSLEDLIEQADQALILAKKAGRNCWRVFSVSS